MIPLYLAHKTGPKKRSSRGSGAGKASTIELEERLARQELLIQTLLRLLLEKKVIHEDEFKEWMDYVDSLDGKRDGKLRVPKIARNCASCGRMNKPNAARCMYCDHEFPTEFLAKKSP